MSTLHDFDQPVSDAAASTAARALRVPRHVTHIHTILVIIIEKRDRIFFCWMTQTIQKTPSSSSSVVTCVQRYRTYFSVPGVILVI